MQQTLLQTHSLTSCRMWKRLCDKQSAKTEICVNDTHLLPSQCLGLSEEQPEHPPRPRSFAPQSNRGRTRKLLSAATSVVAASSSSDMMLLTRHMMAASMLVSSCREAKKGEG